MGARGFSAGWDSRFQRWTLKQLSPYGNSENTLPRHHTAENETDVVHLYIIWKSLCFDIFLSHYSSCGLVITSDTMGTSQDTYLIFPRSLIEPDSYFCSEEWGEFSEGPTARIYGSSYHGRLLAEPHDVHPYIWQIWMKWCVFLTLQRTGHLITLKDISSFSRSIWFPLASCHSSSVGGPKTMVKEGRERIVDAI